MKIENKVYIWSCVHKSADVKPTGGILSSNKTRRGPVVDKTQFVKFIIYIKTHLYYTYPIFI